MSENSQIRLLLISLRSDHGGGPKHILDLAQEYKKSFPEISFSIAAPLDKPYAEPFQNLADHFLFLPHRRFSIFAFVQMCFFISKNKIQVLHSHGRGAGVYSRLYKLLFRNIKVVHTFHGFHKTPGLIGQLKVLTDQFLAKYCDLSIAVAPEEKAELILNKCTTDSNCRVILNGVMVPDNFRKSIQFKAQIGMLARFDYQKGLDLLIAHLLYFYRQDPTQSWMFHLAGVEPHQIEIPDELKARVTIHGKVENSRAFLQNLDLYLSTSRWEGLPLSVLEAMAEGLPTVLSNVTGHDYFLKNKVALGFNVDDSVEFSQVLIKLFRDTQLRQELALAGFHLMTSTHQVKSMAQATASLYKAEGAH